MAEYILNSFIGGETSRRFAGRIDLPNVRNGCETLKNMFVLPEGSILKAPGFKLYKTSPNNDPTKSRLIAVRRSTGESYLIEMYTAGGVVVFEVHTQEDVGSDPPFTVETSEVDVSTDLITLARQAWRDGGTLTVDEIKFEGSEDSITGLGWEERSGTPVKLEAGWSGDSTKIVASDAAFGEYFGFSVSISGDYAIVGASGEESGSAGAAYISHRTGTNTWDAGTKIVASDAQAGDYFGAAVSISGDYAIVGASGEDAGGSAAGAAYIFHRTSANTWDSGVKIVASDAGAGDRFGVSVSISGDYAIVGANKEAAGGTAAGAAYIFRRTGTNTWDAGTKIVASDAQANDNFGFSVAIEGDYAIAGAHLEDAGGADAGAAYIFHRTGTNTWDAGTKIVASDAQASDYFGVSVSISGDYAIVGASGEDAGGSSAGAAYIFHRTGTNTWDSGVKIVASDAGAGDNFGFSVAISGDYLIVGAYGESDGASEAGAAYIFHRTNNTWDAGTKIVASDAQDSDYFGDSVAISGDYAIAGAYAEDTGGNDAGAAYIFERGVSKSFLERKMLETDDTETTGDYHSVAVDGDYIVVGTYDYSTPGSGEAYVYHNSNGEYSETKLLPTGLNAQDAFGYSVSISGEYIAIGANGDDDAYSNAGAVYVFKRSGENDWALDTKLLGPEADSKYGFSVSLLGDYLIVGARRVDGAVGSNHGAAYIYHKTGGVWDAGTKIVAPDAEANDSFGYSVSMNTDYAVVGAYMEDEGGLDAGAAYIFNLSGGTWDTGTKIVAPDAMAGQNFGQSVSSHGDYVVVGAPATFISGNPSAGCAYIYHRTGGVWDAGVRIEADDPANSGNFGYSCDIYGDIAVVGDPYRDSLVGAIYVYYRTGTNTWSEGVKVTCSSTNSTPWFGIRVAFDEGILVGAAHNADEAYVFTPHNPLPGDVVDGTVYYAHEGTTLHVEGEDSISGDNPISLDPVADSEYYLTVYDYTTVLDSDGWSDGDGIVITDIVPEETGDVGVVAQGDDSTTNLVWGSFWDRRNGAIVKLEKGYNNDSTKIVAYDAAAGDRFGDAKGVAVSGDYAIVGAPYESEAGPSSGSAYIFHRASGVWDEGTKVVATDPSNGATFGAAVSISGDYAIVGAPGATGGGAAYIFRRTGTDTWDAGVKIVASDLQASDSFGTTVSIDGDYAIVGASGEDAGGDSAGAAYIFHRTGTNTWDAGVKVVALDTGAYWQFGNSVSISGDYALVGAFSEALSATGAGAAYIFHRTGTNTWDAGVRIVASDAESNDFFGTAVSISGKYAIVGAPGEDTGGSGAGAAYIFYRTATNTWNAGTKIVAIDAEAADEFGVAVSIAGDYAIVGAKGAEAAYIFHRTSGGWSNGHQITAFDSEASDAFGWSASIDGDSAIVGAMGEDAGGSGAGAAYIFTIENGTLPGTLEENTYYYAYQIDVDGSDHDISIHANAKDGFNGTNALSLDPVADAGYHVILHKDLPDELDPGAPYYVADGDKLYPTRADALADTNQMSLSVSSANFIATLVPLSSNKTITNIDPDSVDDLWFTQWSETVVYVTEDGNPPRRLKINSPNDISITNLSTVGGAQIAVSTYAGEKTVDATEDRIYFLLEDLPQLPVGSSFTAKGTWPAGVTVDTVYYLGNSQVWSVGPEGNEVEIGVSYQLYSSLNAALTGGTEVNITADQTNGAAECLFAAGVSAQPETPAIGAVYETRLVLGGGTVLPDRLYGSMTGEPEFFHKMSANDADAWEYPIAGAEYDQIRWAIGGNSLLVGTKNSVYKMGGANDIITPSSIPITRPQSSTGAAAIPPLFFEDFIVFVGENKRSIYGLTYADDVEKYQSQELSLYSTHLLDANVARIEMQKSPFPILWVLLEDGTLASMVYHKATGVIAWSQHDFGVVINDICVIDSTDGNDVLYAQGAYNGVHAIFSLKMNDSGDLYIDSINNRYTATSPGTSVTLPELYWGQTLQMVVDGVHVGEAVIPADGVFSIPAENQGGTQYVFGEVLTPEVKTNEIVESQMSKKRISEIFVKYVDSATFKVGRIPEKTETVTLTGHAEGSKKVQVLGGWDDGQMYITQDSFGSLCVTMVIAEVERA